MTRAGFEPAIPMLERPKKVLALDEAHTLSPKLKAIIILRRRKIISRGCLYMLKP